MLQGRQHKMNSFRSKMAKKCQFLAENSVFLETNRVGGTSPSYCGCVQLRKRFHLVFLGTKRIFMVFLCLYYTIQPHWCAPLFCSTNVVTCGLTRFTRVFPCTKHITGEQNHQDTPARVVLCLRGTQRN